MSVFLIACSKQEVYAPVSTIGTIEPIPKDGKHRVMPGETVYSIAWNFGMDYRDLAKRNHLQRPYHLVTGRVLDLRNNDAPAVLPKVIKNTQTVLNTPPPIEKEPHAIVTAWQWPVKGPVVGNFSALNKGINIGGRVGEPVVATAPGKVVYSGSGLRGYGNLIIIKHNSVFLTAYAHSSQVLVKQGDWVQAGQKIAEMGNTGSRRVMLHFEIRRGGQPVNPLGYLDHKTSGIM